MIEVLSQFSGCVERASVDEAYIDLTEEVQKRMATLNSQKVSSDQLPNTFVVGYEPEDKGNGLDPGKE